MTIVAAPTTRIGDHNDTSDDHSGESDNHSGESDDHSADSNDYNGDSGDDNDDYDNHDDDSSDDNGEYSISWIEGGNNRKSLNGISTTFRKHPPNELGYRETRSFRRSELYPLGREGQISTYAPKTLLYSGPQFAPIPENPTPEEGKEPDQREISDLEKQRLLRKEAEALCLGHIKNTLSDRLFDLYSPITDPKELWKAREQKYKTHEEGTNKYLVFKYLEFQMVDDKPIMEQVHELQVLINKLNALSIPLVELFQIGAIIAKLPPSWKDFSKRMMHRSEDIWMIYKRDKASSSVHQVTGVLIRKTSSHGDKIKLRILDQRSRVLRNQAIRKPSSTTNLRSLDRVTSAERRGTMRGNAKTESPDLWRMLLKRWPIWSQMWILEEST
ncbi:hypothetical protein OSB04_020090 [Centaurea solstitialis]|uniref:Uncharacterized protein n=1 Tax=Centaurea solstitialis TaxID=347529 RepID=A0AA38W5K5_9ASTR|nr:hypothetical protein OSB04_020090 [Centaurea solstitialis]